eukprot:scaffold43348_cov35-Tisochrysis_lutea.AAC.1
MHSARFHHVKSSSAPTAPSSSASSSPRCTMLRDAGKQSLVEGSWTSACLDASSGNGCKLHSAACCASISRGGGRTNRRDIRSWGAPKDQAGEQRRITGPRLASVRTARATSARSIIPSTSGRIVGSSGRFFDPPLPLSPCTSRNCRARA